MTRHVFLALLAWQTACIVIAADIYVAPQGLDTAAGTRAAPFATPARARDAARPLAGKETVTIHLADGTYYLPETLVLEAADSGTKDHPVRYVAEHEGQAVLSGGQLLALKWEAGPGGLFQARTPPGLVIDQLFLDGRCQRMARYPNYDASLTTSAYQGFAADAFSNERAARWSDPTGGFIHAMHASRWGGYEYRITGKKPDGGVSYEGGWQNNRQMGMHRDFRMVENIREELDAPGEWFHDAKNSTLLYMPQPGADLNRQKAEVVRLRHLVEFRGTRGKPVRFVEFRGFVFRHAARTFMDTKEPLLRSDWTIYRGGAVLLTGCEDVTVADCEFDQPGGNAVFVNNYNRRVVIRGCHIHDAGASGVCFVGDPAAVRSPLFEYNQKQDLTKIDRTPGPKTPDYPEDCAVEDCLIHGIGRVERQPAGVQISMAHRIAVRDTSIYDCARAGINISEGTWAGHLIERCDIFDTVLETSDHGSFNSWGRDRYWTGNHRAVSEPAVKADPKLPFLDAMDTIEIRFSRWRCDHGWDIDLDDGSSNYDIHDNLLLNGGLKFREGYRRQAHNNILVNSGFHPHVWFEDSDSTFRHNIVMRPPAPIGMPAGWGGGVDGNFFVSAADLAKARALGSDAHSSSGDPMFVAPALGDFRVRDGSPALPAGFRNFPMDQFGVKKPALKALAKTPAIPALAVDDSPAPKTAKDAPSFWLGASIHALAGEEFSAFGTTKEEGGIQLAEVPKGSVAEIAGLQANDLVLQLNGRPTKDEAAFFAALAAAGEEPLKLKVVRNQQAREITLPAVTPFLIVESAKDPDAFRKLPPGQPGQGQITASAATNNDPLASLQDGKLAKGYGPVFSNGARNGAYKLDLGSVRPVQALTSWTFAQNGNRGRQIVTLYGSASATDPGWNTADRSRFVPLATIDTGAAGAEFTAASLRARGGRSLGSFRWIIWQVRPVTDLGENSAFQELSVE